MWSNVLVLLVIIGAVIYTFAIINPGVREHFDYILQSTEDFTNRALVKLKNANALVNLPTVRFNTNNPELINFQKCKDSAHFLGLDASTDFTRQCFGLCGDDGSVLEVSGNTEYYHEGRKLTPGYWCVVNAVACNTNTSYIVSTVASTVCRPKYPNMFGGDDGGLIVACNDEKYPATGSVLWDHALNQAVNAANVVMDSEDEKMADGNFRFACKFGLDAKGNKYIAHPLNRFHPIPDRCNNHIYRAHDSVHLELSENSWKCNCGLFEDTHVRHLIESDPQSTCTNCVGSFKNSLNELSSIPRVCYTKYSLAKQITSSHPCPPSKFLIQGNECDMITIPATTEQQPGSNISWMTSSNDQYYSVFTLD